jgi:Fe-S-cluster containining protein
MSTPIESACTRCGTCCREGGPALHLEDRRLVADGVIHTRHLFTIRRGETARDPVRGGLVHAEGDIIKIKGCDRSWACRFLEGGTPACRIYADRPLECRLLDCRDPSRIAAAYGRDRLARADLLDGVDGLGALVRDHDARCDCGRVRVLLATPGVAANRELAEIVRFDAELRKLMISRGGLAPDMLDFLLGRPMTLVVRLIQREADPAGEGAAADRAGGRAGGERA